MSNFFDMVGGILASKTRFAVDVAIGKPLFVKHVLFEKGTKNNTYVNIKSLKFYMLMTLLLVL